MKDGGPAFPTTTASSSGHTSGEDGMSLRDYFAAAAIAPVSALILRETELGIRDKSQKSEVRIASMAYEIADAMLSEREKP